VLQVNSSIDKPVEFDLRVDGESRPCRLVWVTDTRAGIEFKSTANNATKAPIMSLASADEDVRLDQFGSNELPTLRAALNSVPIGIVLLDAEMRAQFINQAFKRMWRLSDEKTDSRLPFMALCYHGRDTRAYAVPSGDIDRYIAERVEQVRSGNAKPVDLRHSNGEVIRVQCTALPSGGRMLCYTYVTDLVKDADELAMLRNSLNQMQQGIILLDEFLNARFMNHAVRELWEIPDDQADRNPSYAELLSDLSNTRAHRISADEIDQYIENRIALVRAGDPNPMDIPHRDGRIIRSQCAVLPNGGRMLTYNDVTDLVIRAKQFEELAAVDGLTGLYNRRHLDVLAEAEWGRFQRYRRPLSMILIDIDHFKEVNDQRGHEAGDLALKKLATICMEGARSTDIIARFGGDEFVVLLPETNLQQARTVAERIITATELLEGITFSIGIAEATLSMSSIHALLRAADKALYGAKSAGKNCIWCEGAIVEFPKRVRPPRSN
jgi:diguanylate cyclase (GGDEF)-like protein